MIEQYLQVTIDFLKEVYFQLVSRSGLEETEAFQLIKPFLLQLQQNPAYLGVSLAALVLISFGLYKIKSNTRERDRKLEELMEEMEDEEEEYDEGDPRRLRRTDPEKEESVIISEDKMEKDGDKSLVKNEKEEQIPLMQILEKLDEEDKEDELHINTQKVMGTKEDASKLEPISSELAEPDINKDLSEFEEFDFDSEERIEEDTAHNNVIEEFQEVDLIELDDKEQERAIQELQDEMESTINKLTEQSGSDSESPSSIKDLGDTNVGDETTTDDKFYLGKEAALDGDLSLGGKIEEPVIDKIESEPLQPVPERDYSLDDKFDRKGKSLINRLKYFQENLDTRTHHLDKKNSFSTPEPNSKNLAGEPRFVDQQSFTPKSPRISPEDNKKYMEVLESFIFLKDQNKH